MLFHTSRRGGEFDGMIEGGQRFVVLPKIQVGIAETYLQIGTVGSERRRLLQFRHGQVVLCAIPRTSRPDWRGRTCRADYFPVAC